MLVVVRVCDVSRDVSRDVCTLVTVRIAGMSHMVSG